ncbi:MAG TPA: hypothetical protein O0X23_04180 [Methanocorpusculum sp.]|nr:hypothetical protein [Methanocorpusculum sp.]
MHLIPSRNVVQRTYNSSLFSSCLLWTERVLELFTLGFCVLLKIFYITPEGYDMSICN